jgi:putative ABC transport system permease protein
MSNPGEPIEPLVIANCFWGSPNIYLRSSNPLTESQLMQVKAVFRRFDANFIFNYHFLTDIFDDMYIKENRLAKMVFIGAFQVVIISLISLLSLTILKISRRTREIGIRKVNGSSVSQIISALMKQTLIMVFSAVFVASFISYFVMNWWLSEFTQRIHLHPGYFLVSAMFVLVAAVLATLWQTWRAATRNPVKALRHE